MAEEKDMSEMVSEIQSANKDELRQTIEKWYDKFHTQGLKLGAKYMAIGATSIMKHHLSTPGKKPSLRSYERCIADLNKFFAVQLNTQQNENEVTDEARVEQEDSE